MMAALVSRFAMRVQLKLTDRSVNIKLPQFPVMSVFG
jgi:hypothetical protein